MGHARADVFRRHYMHQTVKVDTQSAYLGTVNRSDLTKSVSLMSNLNKRDPRAPAKLSAEELESHQDHPELAALLLEWIRLATTLRSECRSAKAAETLQPGKCQEYLRLCGQVDKVKKNLRHTALGDLRARWFDNVDHNEIRGQLKGEATSTFAYVNPGFGCPLLKSQISGAFSSVGMITAQA